jgi:hypothetical protein
MPNAVRRIAVGATVALTPALLAIGVAATSHATGAVSYGVPNPGPTVFAGPAAPSGGQGVNGTNIKPGTPEHRHQNNK